jgi:hypothetical protein
MHLADHSHSSRFRHWKIYIFLFFLAILAYWPISFQVFSVKNDAIHYFLPVRYTISNSIQHGYFPYWANSFYLGYPLHGDMQSGVWNPLVQFISLLTTYNITIFHIETLLYIFFAGVGMYKLSGIITHSTLARMMNATAFMLSGYLLGSGEFINWMASAAFIPFVIYYYHRLLHTRLASNALKTAIALWLLLTSGYPADSIIMAYVLAGMFLIYFTRNRKHIKTEKGLIKKYVWLHALLVISTLLLLAPALLSYFELLPYYSRGSGTGLSEAMANSFDPKSSLSFISPWAALANDYSTSGDITGRNIYIGIYPLVFAMAAFSLKNSYRKTILLVAAVTSFLFCLGDATPFRGICYEILPGMDSFRHPSHFRLYTIIALLLLAAMTADQLLQKEKSTEKVTRNIFFFTGGLLLLTAITLLIGSSGKLPDLFSSVSSREKLKIFLQAITWRDMLLATCIIQLFFLGAFYFFSRGKRTLSPGKFLALHIFNLVIMSLLALPASFVSKIPPSHINKLIREKGQFYDTASFNRTITDNSKNAFGHSNEIGLSFFYSHQPGLTRIANSPAFLTSMDTFVQSNLLYNYIKSKPVAWLSGKSLEISDSVFLGESFRSGCVINFSDDPNMFLLPYCDSIPGEVMITAVGPGRFSMNVKAKFVSTLNLSQAYHKNWKAEVNNQPVTVKKVNIAFMGIPVETGTSKITWRYDPGIIPYAFMLSLLTLAGVIVFLVLRYRRR